MTNLAAEQCRAPVALQGMIGAAGVFQAGWIRTDIGHMNILCAQDRKRYFVRDSVLADILRACGFEVNLLEYWDEYGTFHCTDWKTGDGFIRRSRWNDTRNSPDTIKYTSLIVDAVKP